MNVGGETTPHGGTGRSAETEGEFSLEHEDAGSREGSGGEEFEDERGGDLVEGRRRERKGEWVRERRREGTDELTW